jgi:clan AA aspartic protease
MGLVYATLKLSNAAREDLRAVEVDALVDSGAVNLCIPQDVAQQLDLRVLETRLVETADGSTHDVDYVGPVEVRFENRVSVGGALVFGNEVLLGAVQMEDMDVLVHPREERLVVNPKHPNFAVSKVK